MTQSARVRTFRPPAKLQESLAAAQAATGINTSQLMIRCIERALPAVVAEAKAQRDDAFRAFERLAQADTPPAPTPPPAKTKPKRPPR